jgi:hypothetical protein
MSSLDDRDLYELQEALGNLASNPRVPPSYRARLDGLRRAAGARRLAGDADPLTDRDLDQFELMMARLHIAVQAKKRDLELQVRLYDKRENQLAQLLDAVEDKRKEREKEASARARRRRSSRKGSTKETE